jgi:SHO1 osmosensor
MPSHAEFYSPSLRKMEGGGRYSEPTRFSIARIIGDPFALATISIAIVSVAIPMKNFELMVSNSLRG